MSKRQRVEEAAKAGDDGVVVSLGSGYSSMGSQIRLLEATPELLEAVKMGQRVYFTGGEDGSEIMLCTETQTRKVQKVETSNTMLLMPPADVPERSEKCPRFAAAGAATFMYETEVTGPRVDQLRALLSQCPYRGAGVAEVSDDDKRCTMVQLSERVQASVAEIREGLVALDAIEIDGRWCIVEPKVLTDTFGAVLDAILTHDMVIDAVVESAVISNLPEEESCLLQHCLKVYGTSVESAEVEEGERVYKLDMEKVAVFKAHQLFKTLNGGYIPVAQCLFDWEGMLPTTDYTPDESLLAGLALKDFVVNKAKQAGKEKEKEPEWMYRYLPESSLPLEPEARFNKLFEERTKWTKDDLEPYLASLVTPGVSVPSLLLKYTRSIVSEEGTLFSSR